MVGFESYLTTALDRLLSSRTDWYYILYQEFQELYMQEIDSYLSEKLLLGDARIEPPPFDLFTNLSASPAHNTRVVIISDYPYPQQGVSTGRALDAQEYKREETPGTIRNIHRELRRDFKLKKDAELRSSFFYWATQGVLLLNSVWTCEVGKKTAHKDIGWQKFTEVIVNFLSERPIPVVFMLWGEEAQKYKPLIKPNHLILESPHPHPASAADGFMFSSPFTKANKFLRDHNRGPIDWLAIQQTRYGVIR